MRAMLIGVSTLLSWSLLCSASWAQLPFPIPGGGNSNSNTGQRAPNDNVEGTIFEYKCTPKSGQDIEPLEGRFRVEESAIYDVSQRLQLPTGGGGLPPFLGGSGGQGGGEVKLPSAPQQKRLGEYRRLDNKRLRFDFDDEESLNGIMIVQLKENTRDVWIGTYTQREGSRVVREWTVQLRQNED